MLWFFGGILRRQLRPISPIRPICPTASSSWHVADVPGVQGELLPAGAWGSAPHLLISQSTNSLCVLRVLCDFQSILAVLLPSCFFVVLRVLRVSPAGQTSHSLPAPSSCVRYAAGFLFLWVAVVWGRAALLNCGKRNPSYDETLLLRFASRPLPLGRAALRQGRLHRHRRESARRAARRRDGRGRRVLPDRPFTYYWGADWSKAGRVADFAA